jgi:hypothetical protein
MERGSEFLDSGSISRVDQGPVLTATGLSCSSRIPRLEPAKTTSVPCYKQVAFWKSNFGEVGFVPPISLKTKRITLGLGLLQILPAT